MGWNRSKAESPIQAKTAQVPAGAPVALNPGMAGRAYRDGWDIERAYREGMQKVTWVYRCVDTIASNQARLPAILRADNAPDGKIVTGDRHDVLHLLNTKSNQGENSFIFRYRLSSQLLISTRGVFIEKVFGRNGKLVALHLLPPQHTAPIPDPRNFVAGYEVTFPGGGKKVLRPDSVLWIRRPHPLDPYRSLTPMESAGVAIEIENLAKLYNRNFLLNDGRPGGLLVVRGEMDDDDKDELRSRFRGNLNRSGQTTVISSEDGVDFVDTASNPRDAAYTEMRSITKEEILAAFGVPETAIGNASGRTFSNAGEELRVFWMETMLPHLDLLARGFDELDDKHYVDFNTDEVPILVLYRQERERHLLTEFQTGLISGNEYRVGTGRGKVDSELMDSMLANPNLTPIGNTEKRFEIAEQQPVDTAQAEGTVGEQAQSADVEAPADEPAPDREAGLLVGSMRTKSAEIDAKVPDEFDVKAEASVERWTEILDRGLERLFERQQRVVLEKAAGVKARRAVANGTLSAEAIFDLDTWNRQMAEDIRPLLSGILAEAGALTAEAGGTPVDLEDPEVQAVLDAQVKRVQQTNETTRDEVSAAVLSALALRGDDDEANALLKAALVAIFVYLMRKRRRAMAEHEAQSAFNAGVYVGAGQQAGEVRKIWRTRRDDRVRSQHRVLDGRSAPLGGGFKVGEATLRFPGDPLAPPELTIGCRCRLKFTS
jgi:HK97 family phage portal protein